MKKLAQDARNLFNVQLTGNQLIALATYERELLDWNQRINLTAIRDVAGVRTKHFLDSFSCVLAWKSNPPKRLIDVGTGAGFPGIPLKIIYPAMHLTLVESVGKKTKFCQHIVDILGLNDVNVVQIRAEDIAHLPEYREQYDWVVARAVAQLPVLSEYLLPFVKVGGTMLAQKGESGPAEVNAAEDALRILGGHVRQVIPVTLPGVVEDRYLVLADKIGATPAQYPRHAGTPSKKPL